MRLLLASCIAALSGLIAQIVAFGIEVALSNGNVYLPESDWAVAPFALAVAAEMVAVMALWMYRLAPWLLILMRDRFESERISRGRQSAFGGISRVIVISMLIRWIIRTFDSGQFAFAPLASVAICLWPLLLPPPPLKHRSSPQA